MDAERFDTIVRTLAARTTRRRTLGGLIGAGLAGAAATATAATATAGKNGNRKKRDQRRANRNGVQTASDCVSPGPGQNLSGCDFSGENLTGQDLSGSSMRGTNFRNANLCGANLSSSTLTNADFRGANLTRATLRSSNCRGTLFDATTIFCGTTTCNGAVRNTSCPGGVPPGDACCVDVGELCANGGQCCSGICEGEAGNQRCQAHDTGGCQPGYTLADCGGTDVRCPDNSSGLCATTTGNAGYCLLHKFNRVPPCTRDADCKDFDPRGACILCGNGTLCALSV